MTAKGIHWIGPINVPLDRIDTDDEESWAASHQPEAVNRFVRQIKGGIGQTHPAILVQSPGNPKAILVDGHHRFWRTGNSAAPEGIRGHGGPDHARDAGNTFPVEPSGASPENE